MKLTIIGGAGIRTPMFISSAVKRSQRIGLEEICLMDIDAKKLSIIGELCQYIVQKEGGQVRISKTSDAEEALNDCRYAVTTVRVGFDQGRILDERIALKHGILGQETTGAGGFAMALRNIPVILEYTRILDSLNPGAWLFNFTNPSGLVTQALQDRGYDHTVGICDSANLFQYQIAKWLKLDKNELRPEVFGLNHLSWTRRIMHDGIDVLAPMIKNPDFVKQTHLKMFEPELVQQIAMGLNEYLFYYYYAEKAVESILKDEVTRGEEVSLLNAQLFEKLAAIDIIENPEQALLAYYGAQHRRFATYMHYADPNAPSVEKANATNFTPASLADEDGEGYAGVALDLMEALETGKPIYTAVNIPNQGAITGMNPTDVVEISCRVDRDGIHPLPIGVIPEAQLLLMKTIKLYERMTVDAIFKHSRALATSALMLHPLVLSYSRAKSLVTEYLEAHRGYVGEWN